MKNLSQIKVLEFKILTISICTMIISILLFLSQFYESQEEKMGIVFPPSQVAIHAMTKEKFFGGKAGMLGEGKFIITDSSNSNLVGAVWDAESNQENEWKGIGADIDELFTPATIKSLVSVPQLNIIEKTAITGYLQIKINYPYTREEKREMKFLDMKTGRWKSTTDTVISKYYEIETMDIETTPTKFYIYTEKLWNNFLLRKKIQIICKWIGVSIFFLCYITMTTLLIYLEKKSNIIEEEKSNIIKNEKEKKGKKRLVKRKRKSFDYRTLLKG